MRRVKWQRDHGTATETSYPHADPEPFDSILKDLGLSRLVPRGGQMPPTGLIEVREAREAQACRAPHRFLWVLMQTG